MCNPAAFVIGLTSMMGEAVAHSQAKANARVQEKYQNQVYEMTKEAAAANAARQYQALYMRQQQEESAAAQAIDRTVRQAAAAQATARVTAGESGAAGQSVSALMNEYRRQELGFETTTIRNKTWAAAQTQLNAEAIRANQQAQVASAMPRPIEQPNFLGAMLRIAGHGANAYALGIEMNTKAGAQDPTAWRNFS